MLNKSCLSAYCICNSLLYVVHPRIRLCADALSLGALLYLLLFCGSFLRMWYSDIPVLNALFCISYFIIPPPLLICLQSPPFWKSSICAKPPSTHSYPKDFQELPNQNPQYDNSQIEDKSHTQDSLCMHSAPVCPIEKFEWIEKFKWIANVFPNPRSKVGFSNLIMEFGYIMYM